MDTRQLFLTNNAQTSDFPLLLEFEYAEGVYLYNKNKEAYLDLISGIGVSNIGHRNPEVTKAIKEQVDKYMHLMVYGEYLQSPQITFAEKLVAHLPKQLNNVYFTNSGTEAIEGALKLAKRYTQRTEIIAFKNSYHGSSHGALSIMGNENFKQSFRPLLPNIRFIELNNVSDLKYITDKTACVVLESIQGEAGVRVPYTPYLQQLRERCNAQNTLLILDEIQTGFGRTGKLFAFEHFGIVPDILTIAKGMGGGMPIGAFIAPKSIMDCFKTNPILGHITTYGGHPVCCAAGIATLDVLLNENWMAEVEQKELLFRKLLHHPKIKEIRGKGLMLALEFESFSKNKAIIDACITQKVIVDWFLHCDNAMRIAPPLCITETQIKEACDVIMKSIDNASDF